MRTALAACIAAVVTLSLAATASAAPRQNLGPALFSVRASTLSKSPYTDWQPFTVAVSAWQVNSVTHGFVYINDPSNNIRIYGGVTDLTVDIDFGYSVAACGRASGSISGNVCFEVAGQMAPINGPGDSFSVQVVSGGSFLTSGDIPNGSVQSNVAALDNFDVPSLGIFQDDPPEFTYQNGHYVIAYDQSFGGAAHAFAFQLTDSQIDVDGQITGDATGKSLRVGCRFNFGDTTITGYQLSFFPSDGTFQLARLDAQATTTVATGTASNVNFGNGTNLLSLRCKGSTITAWVNRVQIVSVSDGTYQSGGDQIGNWGGNVTAEFDNLMVYQLGMP